VATSDFGMLFFHDSLEKIVACVFRNTKGKTGYATPERRAEMVKLGVDPEVTDPGFFRV